MHVNPDANSIPILIPIPIPIPNPFLPPIQDDVLAYLDNFNALNADGSDASPPPPPVVDSTLTVQDAFGNELTEDSVSVLSAGGAVTLAQPSVTTPGAGVSATVGQGSGDNPIRDWLDFLEPSENWGKWRDVARSGEKWRRVANKRKQRGL